MVISEDAYTDPQHALISIAEAATRLRISEPQLRSWIFRGHARVRKIGRRSFVTPEELDRLAGR
jgi:hypothetical protein